MLEPHTGRSGCFVALEIHGFVLLFSKKNIAESLINDAITGTMWLSVLFGPLWVMEALIAAFFYPVIFYFSSGRERKRLRTRTGDFRFWSRHRSVANSPSPTCMALTSR